MVKWHHVAPYGTLSIPAQAKTCPVSSLYTEANEAPLEERRLKLSMHYYVKTRACIDSPAHHALYVFDRTTRDLYAPKPNGRWGMTRPPAPPNGLKVENANWQTLIDKINYQFKKHTIRNLTLKGRAIITNIKVMSLLWYRATILNIPTRFIKQINILLRSFMWNNRMHLIRQEVLALPTMKGGIDLVNITTKVKALRIKHILIGEVHLRKLPISFTKNALTCLNNSLSLLKH